MNDLLIRFKTLPWEKKEVNVKQKSIAFENKTIRLVLFEPFFSEVEWCFKAHIGIVLEGELQIEFDETSKIYKLNDGLLISKGTKHRIIKIIQTSIQMKKKARE